MTHIQKDLFNEALRVLNLERSIAEVASDRQMDLILSNESSVSMPKPKVQEMLERLNRVVNSTTLGQLLQERIESSGMGLADLAAEVKLPESTLHDIISDRIYTNNVPIMLFKNLLSALDISFRSAEASIRQTFRNLQTASLSNKYNYGLQPTFRSGLLTRNSTQLVNPRNDGRELYENEEALEKYINRLEELLS